MFDSPERPARAAALRGYQARVVRGLLRAIARERGATLTVMLPRQSGKNEIAAVLVAFLLRTHARAGGTVIVCAPTLDPQARISLQRIRTALALTDPLVPAAGRSHVRGDSITVGSAQAVLLSANPSASVAGHTASIALVADEAQDIDEAWFNRQFRPMAASTNAPAVLFGTAWNGRTLLERAAAANRAHDTVEPLGSRRHYQVAWREVAQSQAAYGAYVRAERARLGASHPLFLSQYELVPGEAAGRLLPPNLLGALEGDHEGQSVPEAGAQYVAGLDFGGEGAGADATVLTIARVDHPDSGVAAVCRVVAHREWRSAPYARVLDELRSLDRRWHFARLCAAATGLGAPLTAQLAPQLGARLEPFVFTAASKSALGYALVAAGQTARLTLYQDDGSVEASRCRDELADCEAALLGGGRLAWGNERGHDDYVASLALCLRASEAQGPPRVATGRSTPR